MPDIPITSDVLIEWEQRIQDKISNCIKALRAFEKLATETDAGFEDKINYWTAFIAAIAAVSVSRIKYFPKDIITKESRVGMSNVLLGVAGDAVADYLGLSLPAELALKGGIHVVRSVLKARNLPEGAYTPNTFTRAYLAWENWRQSKNKSKSSYAEAVAA